MLKQVRSQKLYSRSNECTKAIIVALHHMCVLKRHELKPSINTAYVKQIYDQLFITMYVYS